MPLIRWTPEQRNTFFIFIASLRSQYDTATELTAAAMALMPVEQRRPVQSAANEVRDYLKTTPVAESAAKAANAASLIAAAKERAATTTVSQPPPAASNTSTALATTNDVMATEEKETSFNAMAATAAGFILEVFQNVLYDAMLRTALRDLIKETVAPEAQEKIETGVLWRAPVAGQERRKRIVIAAGGGFANSFDTLRPLMRFYDFRFWNSREQHPARLRQLLEGAEVAVLVTNSVSHGGADACRAWARNNRDRILINYTRNISGLVEELPGLLGDEVTLKTQN